MGFVFFVVELELFRAVGSWARKCRCRMLCVVVLLRKRRASSLARAKRTRKIVLSRVPGFRPLVSAKGFSIGRSATDNHVIGVVTPVCVRAESSSLARVCWQRVERRRAERAEIFVFVLFVVGWRAVDGVCALLGAVCAAGAMCAARLRVLMACALCDTVCAPHCVCDSRFSQFVFTSL